MESILKQKNQGKKDPKDRSLRKSRKQKAKIEIIEPAKDEPK